MQQNPLLRTALVAALLAAVSHGAYVEPVSPNPIPAAVALYHYLQDITGKDPKGILSGQEDMLMEMQNDTPTVPGQVARDKYIIQKTGKRPAMYETNFAETEQNQPKDWTLLKNQQPLVDNILDLERKSGGRTVVMICWHAVQPDQPNTVGYPGMSRFHGDYPTSNVDAMLTAGSNLNKEWIARLDSIAGYLGQLRDAGIPVLWRPFHESNGNFFWWGQQPRFKELWAQMYDRFVTFHGLNNLLWVYSLNNYGGYDSYVKNDYPGDDKVDVLSVDDYSGGGDLQYMYDDLTNNFQKNNHKPIGISENGKMPDVAAIKGRQPNWTFWGTWHSFEFSNNNPDNLYTSNYNDPKTITLNDLPVFAASVGISPREGSGPEPEWSVSNFEGHLLWRAGQSTAPTGTVSLVSLDGKVLSVRRLPEGVREFDLGAAPGGVTLAVYSTEASRSVRMLSPAR